MTRTEREQLIERYLKGELTPKEEENFFIEVATDKEMQYDLKASQVVESAIRKDREAGSASWSGPRAELAAMLAAEPALGEGAPKGGSSGAKFLRPQGGFGWGTATIVIGLLVSCAALLISLVAINRTGPEQEALPMPTEQKVEEPVNGRGGASDLYEGREGEEKMEVRSGPEASEGTTQLPAGSGEKKEAKRVRNATKEEAPRVSSLEQESADRQANPTPVEPEPIHTDSGDFSGRMDIHVEIGSESPDSGKTSR